MKTQAIEIMVTSGNMLVSLIMCIGLLTYMVVIYFIMCPHRKVMRENIKRARKMLDKHRCISKEMLNASKAELDIIIEELEKE